MRRKKILLTVILSVFVFSLTTPLQAQDQDEKFSGNFLFGYRMIDKSGANYKYMEDINLDEGARLFSFSLHYTPDGDLKKLFDRIDVNAYNFGGDPFETFGLSIQKYGKYKFQYDRKKSTYFYHDLHETGGGVLYDMRTFNFDRVMDSGFLKFIFGRNVNVYLNFDRYTKNGDSITTYDIDRIEFEFDKPIKEESREVTVGVDVHSNRYSIVAEKKYTEYENSNSLFLPGYADGGAGARYPSALDYFYLNQPYELNTNVGTIKFHARPHDNLMISGNLQTNEQKMDLTFSESAKGINFIGDKYDYGYNGSGKFDRKFQMFDVDISYLLFNKLAIVGAYRNQNFHQWGSLNIEDESESIDLKFENRGFEGGLQFQPNSKFALTLGYRYETRELDGIETVDYEDETTSNGLFGNLKLDLSRKFKMTLDYQHGSYDNPYTLISPTSISRFKATAKVQAEKVSLSGSYLLNTSKTDLDQDWESKKNQINFRIGYHVEKISLSGGYAYINVKHEGKRNVAYPPAWSGGVGTFLWDILYEGKSNLLDGAVHLNLYKNWKIGYYANSYTNTGFWEISRTMLKGFVEYTFDGGFIVQLAHRYVKFKEKDSGYNNYKANIVEISFGYRWQ